jgi:hypothetical protein
VSPVPPKTAQRAVSFSTVCQYVTEKVRTIAT